MTGGLPVNFQKLLNKSQGEKMVDSAPQIVSKKGNFSNSWKLIFFKAGKSFFASKKQIFLSNFY